MTDDAPSDYGVVFELLSGRAIRTWLPNTGIDAAEKLQQLRDDFEDGTTEVLKTDDVIVRRDAVAGIWVEERWTYAFPRGAANSETPRGTETSAQAE